MKFGRNNRRSSAVRVALLVSCVVAGIVVFVSCKFWPPSSGSDNQRHPSQAWIPAYVSMNNTWRLPEDFLESCDDFALDGIPIDHPMKLHLLFGPNASEVINADESAQLMHDAAAIVDKVDNLPSWKCQQSAAFQRQASPRPNIGEPPTMFITRNHLCALSMWHFVCISNGDDNLKRQWLQRQVWG